MADAADLAELLHVEVDQGAGAPALVALDRARRLEARQAIEPVAPEERHDGAHREGVVLGDAQRTPPLAAAAEDLPPLMPRELPGEALRPRGAVHERGGAIVARRFGAAGPLPRRLAGHADPVGDAPRGLPRGHALHREGSPARRTPCLLVNVH